MPQIVVTATKNPEAKAKRFVRFDYETPSGGMGSLYVPLGDEEYVAAGEPEDVTITIDY